LERGRRGGVRFCLANDIRSAEALDGYRPVKAPDGTLGPPPRQAPSMQQLTVPTTLSAGEFSAISGITDGRRRVRSCSGTRK
jgi:maleylacetate reductase